MTYHDIPVGHVQSFKAQLKAVSSEFEVIGWPEFKRRLESPRSTDEPAVLLTFDDGFKTAVNAARDVLGELGLPGIFFIPTGFIDCASPLEAREYVAERILPGRPRMHEFPSHLMPASWAELAELVRDGHTIGAHTINHYRLREAADINGEVDGGAGRLAEQLGVQAETFAIPFGTPNTVSAAALARVAARHRYIFTSIRGENIGAPRLALRRHAVTPSASPGFVVAELAGVLSIRHAAARKAFDALAGAAAQTIDAPQ